MSDIPKQEESTEERDGRPWTHHRSVIHFAGGHSTTVSFTPGEIVRILDDHEHESKDEPRSIRRLLFLQPEDRAPGSIVIDPKAVVAIYSVE